VRPLNYARPESIDNPNSSASAEEIESLLPDAPLTTVSNIASQFLAATDCKTAALVTTAYYLRSTTDLAGLSLRESRCMAIWLHQHATNLGYQIHESADELADRIEAHYLDQQYAWHQSIDAAIYRARDWIWGHDVPPEIRYVLHQCGIRTRRFHVVICVAWALQQQGVDWFFDSAGLAEHLGRHGIDCGLDGRAVREVLRIMRDCGVIEITAPSEFARRCARYRYSLPPEIDAPDEVVLTRGKIQKSSISEALMPIYAGALSPPSGLPLTETLALPAPHGDPSPQRDQSHSGGLSGGQHIVADCHINADRADVLEAAVGREIEIVEELASVDLERSGSNKAMTCPSCRKKKKLVANRTGGLHCYRCGRLGGNVIDVLMRLQGWTYHESLTAVARYLDVRGEQRPDRTVMTARRRQVPQRDDSTLDDIIERVAAAKGVTVAGLQHYGAAPAWRDYQPRRNITLRNAVARIPLRRPDGTQTSHIDIGVACRSLRKGLCPSGEHEAGVYLPDDYDMHDERPVVLVEGAKDPIKAWELSDGAYHAIGIQGGYIPPELAQSMQGRTVIIIPDCDQTGRRNAERWRDWLLRYGARCEIRDPDPARTDGAGIRELAAEDEAAVRRLLSVVDVSEVITPVAQPQQAVDCTWIDSVFV